jgi:hypothetical protein
MAAQVEKEGKPDDSARSVAEQAKNQYVERVENGTFPLEAESDAKKNHMFLPSEEDMPLLGEIHARQRR